MIKKREIKKFIIEPSNGRFSITDEHLNLASDIALQGWIKRAKERSLPVPSDMSGGCKFSTLLIKSLFGGVICGNYDHQFNVINGHIIDINEHCQDVLALRAKGIDPYTVDTLFLFSPDHLESMFSCMDRVNDWVATFERLADRQNGLELEGP